MADLKKILGVMLATGLAGRTSKGTASRPQPRCCLARESLAGLEFHSEGWARCHGLLGLPGLQRWR